MNSVIRKPYLVFNYVIKTHQFNPSQFFNPIPQVREKLHHEIDILHQLGWGYTKIHHHLVNNGFKIGESRTTVDKILKKMKKRETFLTQPIIIELRPLVQQNALLKYDVMTNMVCYRYIFLPTKI